MSAENVNVTLLKTRTYALLQEQTFVYNRTKSKKKTKGGSLFDKRSWHD